MATVAVNGIELFYEASGPADAPVIVFAHSIGTDHSIFDAQVAALGDRYRTIRYDLRGHGRSAAFDRPVTIADLAADQAALLDALGVAKAHVAGLSIGGMVAQAFAARSPERVRSLALIATSAHLPPAQFWHDRAALVRTSSIGAAADLVLPRWFTEPYRARHPEVIAGFRRRSTRPTRRVTPDAARRSQHGTTASGSGRPRPLPSSSSARRIRQPRRQWRRNSASIFQAPRWW